MADPKDGTPDDATSSAEHQQPEQGGGTPDAGKGDDRGKLIATLQDNVHEQKSRAEKAEAEAAALKARLEQPPPPATPAGVEERMAKVRLGMEQLRTASEAGEPLAMALYEGQKATYAELNRLKEGNDFAAMPDGQRDGARDFYKSGDYRTPEAARKAWLGSLSDDERGKVLGKPKPSLKPRVDRDDLPEVDTSPRPLSSAGVAMREARGNVMKAEEWVREWEKAEGAGDEKRLKELRRIQAR